MGVVPRTKREEEVLKACNEIRASLGRMKRDELEKGTPKQAGHCPIANTIGDVSVIGSIVVLYGIGSEPDAHWNRDVFGDFVEDFDAGKLPYLVAA